MNFMKIIIWHWVWKKNSKSSIKYAVGDKVKSKDISNVSVYIRVGDHKCV